MSRLGSGATNLITGVADANSDSAPLVAIIGQVGTKRMHLTSHRFLNLVNMFSPITKRSKQIFRQIPSMKLSGLHLNTRKMRRRGQLMWICDKAIENIICRILKWHVLKIWRKKEKRYGSSCFVDFTTPDFVKFAESMHAIGYRIEKTEDLLSTLEKVYEQTVPVIIDCPVDYDEDEK